MTASTTGRGAHRKLLVALLSVQWLGVLVPISLSLVMVNAAILAIPADQVIAYTARCLLFVAALTLLQMWVGHRVAAFEGPSTVTMAALAVTLYAVTPPDPVAAMAGGFAVSGLILVAIVASGAMRPLIRAYTPLVNSIFLVTLALTVIVALLPDLVAPGGQRATTLLILATVVVVLLLPEVRPHKGLTAISPLLAFIAGLGVAAVAASWMPHPAPYRPSQLLALTGWDLTPAVALPVGLTGILVAINGLASAGAVQSVSAGAGVRRANVNRGLAVTGLSHLVQSILPGMATVPHAESAVLVARSPHLARRTLALACAATAVLALSPVALRWLAGVPVSVTTSMVIGIVLPLGLLGLRQVRSRAQDRGRLAVFALAVGGAMTMVLVAARLPAVLQLIALSPVAVAVGLGMAGEAAIRRRER